MKKYFLPALVALTNAPAFAEETQQVEHVLVTMPMHKKEAQTALPVTVLSGDELKRQAAATIGETLNLSPGLSSASFGPAVGQPVIRGQQGARVQVLQNGLPALDVSTNSADHAVSVEPVLADSIEILRGPATMLYGGGAIGGVVNVIDGRIPVKAVNGVEGAAEFRNTSVDDGRSGVFRVDAGNGRWVVHVDALYRDWSDPDIPGLAINPDNVDDIEENTDGSIGNASGRTRRVTLGSSYHFEDGYWGVSYTELSNQYGIPSGVHHHDEDHEEEDHDDDDHDDHDEDHDEDHEDHDEDGVNIVIDQTRWDAAGDLHLAGPLDLFRWRVSYSDYQHQEIESTGEVGTTFSKEAWAGRLELSHKPWGNWHGVWGLQLLESDFSALGEESFVPENTTRSVGLFWLEDYHADKWSLEAGLRADFDSLEIAQSVADDQDDSSVSASLAGMYDISDIWVVSLALSESQRAPNAEERFSNIGNDLSNYVVHGATGAIEIGDENLETEKSRNVDLSLRANAGDVRAKFSIFYNEFSDYIYLDNTGTQSDETDILQYRQQDASFSGVEYEVSYDLASVGAEQRYTFSLFGDRVDAELDNGDNVPRLPPGHDGLSVAWQWQDWQANVSYVYAHAQNDVGVNDTTTDAYKRVDASIARDFVLAGNDYTIMLKGRNLADEEIRNSTSFIRDYAPEAGRNIELVMRVNF
ncbi:putative TonB-dependent receptor [Zhongshania aliphaticivorans]|uniref:Putative TonB-dependent receptor n=1 Tax=Zhongshania aliphaticivorans TaxID=1470434 RepID=A0A5S9MR28_9GAMM|nr:TonB-dependent receptor [Zhongshania aliphaticivorans]CAA0079571.1 putative TonB-dependent receptor [Zhongshania aliphaticivorans]CAA0086076.1 putative TonB-dependent receptor [Zhongshania aliphaticivorans]